MPGNSFGQLFRLTSWGESHGVGLGVVIDGCPAGIELSEEDFAADLARRRPGQSRVTTQRKEEDRAELLSGVFEGRTTGMPIALLVRNTDVDSGKYDAIRHLFRPGHADYTYQAKYGLRDHRGGGRSSARETVARVIGGVIAKKIIARRGMRVLGYTVQIGGIVAKTFDDSQIERNPVRCADALAAEQMEQLILACRKERDSVGGIVEVRVRDMPAGLGEPVFHKLDAEIAAALMSIGAVRGVEFGAGFAVAGMRGSQCNDAMRSEGGRVTMLTNHAGGVEGGISNGADLVVRIAVKPTSSIAQPQQTVDDRSVDSTILVEGRHDPAICPRIVPVAEAMVALVLADHVLRQQSARIAYLDAVPRA